MANRPTDPRDEQPLREVPPEAGRARIVATLPSAETAERVARQLREAGFEPRVGSTEDRQASLRGEMADEVATATMGPGSVGPFTKAMSRGALKGVLIGGAVGAAAGLLVLLLPSTFGLSRLGLAIAGAVSGAMAGATAGFVWGGFRSRAEGEGEQLAAERGVTIGVTIGPGDPPAERAHRILGEHSPERLDESDERGKPVDSRGGEDPHPVRGEHRAGKRRE